MIRFDNMALMRVSLAAALRNNPKALTTLLNVSSQVEQLLQSASADLAQALADLQPAASSTRVLTVVNKSTVVTDSDFQAAVAAVQQQVSTDLAQAWDLGNVTVQAGQDTQGERVYVLDNSDQAGALGYHTEDNSLVPVGYVFAVDSQAAGGDWATTLSHEVVEQICDPYTVGIMLTTLQGQLAGVALEVCDPVENDTYQVGGRAMSNFVSPEWFNPGFTGPVDQLGRLSSAGTMSTGGYVAFTLDLQNWQQVFGQGVAAARRQTRPGSRLARRFKRTLRKPSTALTIKK